MRRPWHNRLHCGSALTCYVGRHRCWPTTIRQLVQQSATSSFSEVQCTSTACNCPTVALTRSSLLQVAYESWHIIWAVTGVVGFLVLAFPEALNIVSGIKARRSGAPQPLRAGGSGAFAKDSPGASASEDSGSKPVSSYTATAI